MVASEMHTRHIMLYAFKKVKETTNNITDPCGNVLDVPECHDPTN